MSLLVALSTYNKKNSRSRQELPPVAQVSVSDPVPVRRSQRRLGPDEVAALAEARREGAEIKKLAERFGVHRATVIAHLERAGVPGRRRQGRQLSPEQVQEAGQLYASGVSLIEVGERFDVDRRYLRKALPAAGYPLRPPGRQAVQ